MKWNCSVCWSFEKKSTNLAYEFHNKQKMIQESNLVELRVPLKDIGCEASQGLEVKRDETNTRWVSERIWQEIQGFD